LALIKVRYLERRRLKGGAIAFYYCPPDDAIEAGILVACPLGSDEIEAATKAKDYNLILDQWRAGDRPTTGFPPGTIGWLSRQYQKSNRFLSRKPKTQKGYLADLNRIETFKLKSGRQLGDFLAAAITPEMADAMYQALKPKGLRTANGVMVMAAMLWNFGIRYHKRDHGIIDNPFSKMGLTQPNPRSTRWTMEQVDKFVETADANNAESVGTAALICYLFNQRVTDAITMPKTAWDGEALQIRQSKTRTLVWVPAMKEFRDRMAKVAVPEDVTTLIADERTGIPYTEFAISDRVAIIRDLAGLPKHLQLRDLKRTGTTETSEAGATIHELQATNGNSLETLQVYSVPTNPEAKAAVRKRERHRTKLRKKASGGPGTTAG